MIKFRHLKSWKCTHFGFVRSGQISVLVPSYKHWIGFSSNETVQNKHISVDELSGSLIICIEMYDDGRVTSVHCINRLSRSESWTALRTAPCIQRTQIVRISQWYWFQVTIWMLSWSQEIKHIWWSVTVYPYTAERRAYWEIHPPRTERFSKGFKGAKCQRKILRSEAEVLPNASRVKAVYGHSLACEFLHCSLSSLLQVNIKKYIPKVRWILTVLKINTSLIMMRECEITTFPWG